VNKKPVSTRIIPDYLAESLEKLIQIIEGCVQNDPKCQKWFYEHYFGFSLKAAFRYVYTYEKAIDACNDAFVKIFRKLQHFQIRDPENIEKMLMGWIKRIVINSSIDFMRRERQQLVYDDLTADVWDRAFNPLNADHNLKYKELIIMIKNLSPAYRAVFNMHVIDGFSHQEIAGILGISIGASKSNLSKARAQLQKLMIKDNMASKVCFT
jgi:RNA polymerase sigma factor (sigma-70 family)